MLTLYCGQDNIKNKNCMEAVGKAFLYRAAGLSQRRRKTFHEVKLLLLLHLKEQAVVVWAMIRLLQSSSPEEVFGHVYLDGHLEGRLRTCLRDHNPWLP